VHGKAANFRPTTCQSVHRRRLGRARDTRLDLFEFDAYFIRGDSPVQGQLSYGQQKKRRHHRPIPTGELRDARWWGAVGLVAYKFDPRFEGIVRSTT
jgi:hypothetical protein